MYNPKLCRSFKFLYTGLEKQVNKRLKDKDVSLSQSLVLLWLDETDEKSMPIKAIEKRFGSAQSTTLGIINRLEQKSLISTHLSPKRTKIVAMTDDGLALVSFIKTCIGEGDEMMFAGFSAGERLVFIELLSKAERNLSQTHGIEVGDFYE